MLDILSEMYEKPSVMNKVYMMRRHFNLKMSESSLVVDHINEFHLITAQLCFVGIDFDDEVEP